MNAICQKRDTEQRARRLFGSQALVMALFRVRLARRKVTPIVLDKLKTVLFLVLLSGCGASNANTQPAAPGDLTPAEPPQRAPPSNVSEGVPPAPSAAAKDTSSQLPTLVQAPLQRFFRGLWGLEHQRRERHVRILWFGDSHTAADFMTGRLRSLLQRRFGNGGPGFVRIGSKHSRHDDVQKKRDGRWWQRPRSPASHTVEEDGVLGISGIKARPRDAGASAYARARERKGLEQIHWELVFKPLSERVRFNVKLGNKLYPMDVSLSAAQRQLGEAKLVVRGSQLLGLRLSGARDSALRISGFRGQVDVFGVYLDNATPGVTLDAMGINGARVRTHQAWHPGVFWGEVAERDPDLIVLAYGTNELGDAKPVEEFFRYYKDFISQARDVVPSADCLLVGPTDRLGSSGQSLPRARRMDDAQAKFAERLGCAYFSPLQQMLKGGGYRGWANLRPPLAGQDGVHLRVEGYWSLAAALFEQLMIDYSAFVAPASDRVRASSEATNPPRSR